MTPSLKTFLINYRTAQLAGATDFLITPVFASRPVVLDYYKGKLKSDVPKDVVIRSGIRRDLFEGLTSKPSFLSSKNISIAGHRVDFNDRKWFIAEELLTGSTRSPLRASLPLQLHFLAERKFLTVRPLMSWLSVVGMKADGSPRHQKLPESKSDAIEAYKERVAALNETLTRSRVSYWHPQEKATGKGRVLPVELVIGLRIAYATVPKQPLLTFSLSPSNV